MAPKNGKLTLTVPASANREKPMVLLVTVGRLPRNCRIVIQTEEGELVGVVAPFGAATGEAGVVHPVPLPEKLRAARKLSLAFSLQEKGSEGKRAPTVTEVTSVTLRLER